MAFANHNDQCTCMDCALSRTAGASRPLGAGLMIEINDSLPALGADEDEIMAGAYDDPEVIGEDPAHAHDDGHRCETCGQLVELV